MMGRQCKQRSLKCRAVLLKQRGVTTLSIAALASLGAPMSVMPSRSGKYCRLAPGLHGSNSLCKNVLPSSARIFSNRIEAPRTRLFSGEQKSYGERSNSDKNKEHWHDMFSFHDWTHNSAKIIIPPLEDKSDVFSDSNFKDCLDSTILALREMERTSLWVEVHISRSRLIEEMAELGLKFHHAEGDTAVLNMWLQDSESLVPDFATHHVGVGGLCINSRNEILCVRELKRNYTPWKMPGGLSELGEHLDEAVVREVYEETGIRTKFRDVLCFRHTHGMAHSRSDMYFVCRIDPIEEEVGEGNVIIPEPVAQEGEIEAAAWVPYQKFREQIFGEQGSPILRHVLDLHERAGSITLDKQMVQSTIPGNKPNPIYSPILPSDKNGGR